MKRLISLLAIVALMGTPALARKSMMTTMPTCRSSDPVVWVNTRSHVIHLKGDARYGTTKAGMYACESDALAKGAHLAGHKSAAGNAMSGDTMSGNDMSGMKHHHKKHDPAMMSPAPMPAST